MLPESVDDDYGDDREPEEGREDAFCFGFHDVLNAPISESVNGLNQRRRILSTLMHKYFRVVHFVGQSEGMAKGKEKEGEPTERAVQVVEKKKTGRPLKSVSEENKKMALEAARLGMPMERVAVLAGFPTNSSGTWSQFLTRNPDFAAELERVRSIGELELTRVVSNCGPGWQGSAWLLERTRGYVARAQLEHTGKGGKELSVSGALLGAFGGSK